MKDDIITTSTQDLWTTISNAVGIDRQEAKLVIMKVISGMNVLDILKDHKLPLMKFNHLIVEFDMFNNAYED